MLFGAIAIASLALFASGCAPGNGQITSTPKFSFTFYPPVPWTFSNDAAATTPGQWGTADDARRTMKNDVDAAISAAVKRSGYEGLLGSTSYNFGGYNADLPFPIGTALNQYIVEFGAVTKKYTSAAARRKREVKPQIAVVLPNRSTMDNVQNFNLDVTKSPVSLSTDQWAKISRDVYTILSVRYKVQFVSDITVSA